ncbi:MAG: hypothetical protein ABIH46_00050 [Chloroflexota bacterium]
MASRLRSSAIHSRLANPRFQSEKTIAKLHEEQAHPMDTAKRREMVLDMQREDVQLVLACILF